MLEELSSTGILGHIYNLEVLSLTGILGQIRIKYQKEFWGMTQNPITDDMEEIGNFDVDMPYIQSRIHSDYDSAGSTAGSDPEDGEVRKMLASPLYAYGRREHHGSSQRPIGSGKPEAKIIQKEQVQIVLKLITLEERV